VNNEAERLNVRGLLGVSDFCISIEGNKKSVGEFIEFEGLSGRERDTGSSHQSHKRHNKIQVRHKKAFTNQ
jgi:hypothetical protein